jgi:hypothetical protein
MMLPVDDSANNSLSVIGYRRFHEAALLATLFSNLFVSKFDIVIGF